MWTFTDWLKNIISIYIIIIQKKNWHRYLSKIQKLSLEHVFWKQVESYRVAKKIIQLFKFIFNYFQEIYLWNKNKKELGQQQKSMSRESISRIPKPWELYEDISISVQPCIEINLKLITSCLFSKNEHVYFMLSAHLK